MTKIDLFSLFLYYLFCFVFVEPVFFTIVGKTASVQQGSFLEHSFLLFILMTYQTIYKSTIKLFPDDTSLFSAVIDNNISANELNQDLQKHEWVYKWKMSFNPDLNNQAQKVIFPRKINNLLSHQKNFFNNTPVVCAS